MPIARCTCFQCRLPVPTATDAVPHLTCSILVLHIASLATSSQHVSAFTPTNIATSVLHHDTGVGTNDSGTNQCVQGTDTFYVIDYDNIPFDRRSEIIYSKVVCKVRLEKSDPDRTRITIGSNRICYTGM
eukprot:CCRYP_003150-RA/>CCRYP_003150-RA protein AED:0.48 eAED:0.48 QI:0/0/0/1/0/0/2/0/129